MKTRYQDMFDEVHASPRLKEEVMNMTKQERNQVVRRVSMSFVAAAILAAILVGTALAAVIGLPETLQDWYDQQWTKAGGGEMPEEQFQVIEGLVQPIGVSAVSDGVTVTLDSVMPGENCLWLLLTAEGDFPSSGDGSDGSYEFVFVELTGPFVEAHQPEAPGVGQASLYGFPGDVNGVTEDGTLVILLQYSFSNSVPFQEGGEFVLHLKDLVYEVTMSSITVTANLPGGEWTLPFTLQPTEEQPVLTAAEALVPRDGEGDPVSIRNIRVSSTGLNFEITSGFFYREGYQIAPIVIAPIITGDIALQLSGGLEIKAQDMFGSWSGEPEKSPWETRYSWELPVDLSKAEAVRFEDVIIPLERPEK